MNADKLREAMQEKGISVKRMCQEIGISRKAFWSKCEGKSEFKLCEIIKIVDLLGTDRGIEIFFPSEWRKGH